MAHRAPAPFGRFGGTEARRHVQQTPHGAQRAFTLLAASPVTASPRLLLAGTRVPATLWVGASGEVKDSLIPSSVTSRLLR